MILYFNVIKYFEQTLYYTHTHMLLSLILWRFLLRNIWRNLVWLLCC